MEEEHSYLHSEEVNPNYGTTSTAEEVDDRMALVDQEGRKLPQYIAALSATLGALAAGTALAFTSPTELPYTKDAFLGFNVTDSDFQWVGSLTPLGALAMCLVIGFILDAIGPKLTMLLTIIIFTIGWLLIIFAHASGMLMGGRFLTGAACGTFCIAAPMYTSEIAQKEIRGTLGTYFQLMITIGILLTYTIGSFVNPQVLAIICGIVPFVFGGVFIFMPDSPVFALKKGRTEKAKNALQWLRGEDYNVEDEIKVIQDGINEDKNNPASIRDTLRKRATKTSLFIAFGLMVFQQTSGINAVIFYTSSIFESAGSTLEPKYASIIVGVMQFFATLVSTIVIDRLGRRILLLLSTGIMGLCCLMLGIFFYLKEHDSVTADTLKTLGFLPILSLSIFIIVFSLGFGPIPWMMLGEIFPRNIKAVASSVSGSLNWFLAFLVTLFFPSIKNAIGGDNAFFIFMACCVLGVVFVFFIVPETKGKSLEEIQRELGEESSARSSASRGVVNQGYT